MYMYSVDKPGPENQTAKLVTRGAKHQTDYNRLVRSRRRRSPDLSPKRPQKIQPRRQHTETPTYCSFFVTNGTWCPIKGTNAEITQNTQRITKKQDRDPSLFLSSKKHKIRHHHLVSREERRKQNKKQMVIYHRKEVSRYENMPIFSNMKERETRKNTG